LGPVEEPDASSQALFLIKGALKRLLCTSFTPATVYAEAINPKNEEYSGKIKIPAGGNK
jgi:hypothetical protein